MKLPQDFDHYHTCSIATNVSPPAEILQAMGKCKRLRKDLRKNKDYVTLPKTQPEGINSDVSFHVNSLRK